MKIETLKAVLLLMVCSGFWVAMLMVAAQFWGVGFAQNPNSQPSQVMPNMNPNALPPNDFGYNLPQESAFSPNNPQANLPTNQAKPQLPPGQPIEIGYPNKNGQTTQNGQLVPRPNVPQMLNNNAVLQNQGQASYNLASGEVHVPFQLDTSRFLAFSAIVDNQWQTITVLDTSNQTLAVYQVALTANGQDAGKCYLRSVRNIAGDLKFDEYEATKPRPSEVRAIVEQK
jgi:hypothetical protein